MVGTEAGGAAARVVVGKEGGQAEVGVLLAAVVGRAGVGADADCELATPSRRAPSPSYFNFIPFSSSCSNVSFAS